MDWSTASPPRDARRARLVRIGGVAALLTLAFTLSSTALSRADEAPFGRVYEKVTPTDKNGGNALPGVIMDRDHVGFASTNSLLADDPFFTNRGWYFATRTATGWSFRTVVLAPNTNVADRDPDGTFEIIEQVCDVCPKVTADDSDATKDVYVRSSRGLERISKGAIGGNAEAPAVYAGSSADLSHILFETTEHLEPADDGRAEGTQLYERVGGQLRLVGLDSNENLISTQGAVLGNGAASIAVEAAGSSNAVSRDGSVVFFESPDPDLEGNHQLYARVDGERTVHVSAPHCSGDCGALLPATFQGASDDGSTVYFTTAGRLLDEDADAAYDLYRYHLGTDTLTLISADCEAADGTSVDCGWNDALNALDGVGVIAVSQDGGRVYFAAPPAGGGDPADPQALTGSIWVYDDSVQHPAFVAPMGGNSRTVTMTGLRPIVQQASATPDGDVLVFESSLKITAFDNTSANSCIDEGAIPVPIACNELYRFSFATGAVDCISCNVTGTPPQGSGQMPWTSDVREASQSLSEIRGGQEPNHVISDDGRTIVFSTTDGVLPQDRNLITDVYEWNQGRLALLSGVGNSGPAALGGVTPDGTSVFFSTYDALVPSDRDRQADVYAARVGGRAEDRELDQSCGGDACQPEGPAPQFSPPASLSYAGPGNVKPHRQANPRKRAKAKKCKGKLVRKRIRGRIRCVKPRTKRGRGSVGMRSPHRR